MQNPRPINTMSTAEVEKQGWAAEARDQDGHLISTVAWLPDDSINQNYLSLGEFIQEYQVDGPHVVQIFQANINPS